MKVKTIFKRYFESCLNVQVTKTEKAISLTNEKYCFNEQIV